jgi:hypothetical protein
MDSSPSVCITAVTSTGSRHSFSLATSDSVSDLIKAIESDDSFVHPPDSTTVVIYRGRILDPSALLSSIDSIPEYSVLVFFRLPTEAPPSQEELEGFSRLLRMNYSESQVADIRAEFHSVQGTEEEPRATQIAAEEEWFSALFNAGRSRDAGRVGRGPEPNELPTWRLFFLFVIAFLSALFFGPISLIVLFVSCPSRASAAGLVLGLLGFYFSSTYSEMISSIRMA